MDLDTIRKNIQDIGGIRVITNYIDDVYRVESALTQQSDVTLLKRKDYIKTPSQVVIAACTWLYQYRSFSPTVSLTFQLKSSYAQSEWICGPAWSTS